MKHAEIMAKILQKFLDSNLEITNGLQELEAEAKKAIDNYKTHEVWKDSDNADNHGTISDPYAHLKEAQERGEVLQWMNERGEWEHNDFPEMPFSYSSPPDRYRIKPKTKTLYLWAFRNKTGWRECQKFSEHQPSIFDAIEYKRLDYTAIEVEA